MCFQRPFCKMQVKMCTFWVPTCLKIPKNSAPKQKFCPVQGFPPIRICGAKTSFVLIRTYSYLFVLIRTYSYLLKHRPWTPWDSIDPPKQLECTFLLFKKRQDAQNRKRSSYWMQIHLAAELCSIHHSAQVLQIEIGMPAWRKAATKSSVIFSCTACFDIN